jgi:RNA polymerase sigma-70 factor (ECF subfamily)
MNVGAKPRRQWSQLSSVSKSFTIAGVNDSEHRCNSLSEVVRVAGVHHAQGEVNEDAPGDPVQPVPRHLHEGVSMTSTAYAAALQAPIATVEDNVPAYVRRAMVGDAHAFTQIYQLHRRDVARLAARLLGPRHDLDDVIQEVFIQVFRSLPAFRAESRFSTWLHRVTVNVTLMHLRAAKSRPQLAFDVSSEAASAENESPFEGVVRNERMEALYRILGALSEKKRVVFILHDLEGVAAGEIAKMVGSPVLTVRTRLFYARREVYAAMAADPTLEQIGSDLQRAASGGGET